MLLPAVILALIYSYGPKFGLVMVFEDYNPALGFFRSKWVGWDNFSYVFHLPDFRQALVNTLYIAVMNIIFGHLVPIAVALLLNEIVRTSVRRWFQSLIYLPHFLSWVILAGSLVDLLSPSSGLINHILGWFGIHPIFFLGDNHWFRFTLISTHVWKEFGFGTILYLAAIVGINPSLYEAARIDGAGHWRQAWSITIPGMLPIIVLTMTLALGSILNAGFDQVFNLYSPSVYKSGDIIDTLVYRVGLQQAQFSVAAAVGLFKSVISCIMVSVSYILAYRLANYRIF